MIKIFSSKKLITITLLFLLILACSKNVEEKTKEKVQVTKVEPIQEPKLPEKVQVKEEKIEKTIKNPPAGYPQIILPQKQEDTQKNKLKVEKLLSNDCEYIKRVVNGKEELYTPVVVEMDDFGYVNSMQCQQPVDKGKSSKSVAQAAKDKLNTYENYLGTSQVEVEFEDSREAYDNFVISTKNQKYNKIPVLQLKNNNVNQVKIILFLSRSDVLKDLRGHYYSEINIPITPQITVEQASNNLIGQKIQFADESGDQKTKEIKKSELSKEGELVVLAKETPQKIEYRLAWKISVGGLELWTALVDAQTGETIIITQNFET
ncbi:hypothetical protein HZA97_00970 [Candidatus Woesearchaeota archaeon]|nr:hypothetical protein [Candidatus Woesearchaeota archaeon]